MVIVGFQAKVDLVVLPSFCFFKSCLVLVGMPPGVDHFGHSVHSLPTFSLNANFGVGGNVQLSITSWNGGISSLVNTAKSGR